MDEYTRDKILPEDLIQKTNLQQHNFMIAAINDINGQQDKFNLYEHTIKVTGTSAATFDFSLTVLNQTPTAFTLHTLHSYLGGGVDDYKQCSGLGWLESSSIDLIGVRGGAANQFFFEGVSRIPGTVVNLVLDLTQIIVTLTDRVRQIV